MDAQKKLPANFVDALKAMVGMQMYIGCIEGRMCYRGELVNVSNDLINVLENGSRYTIYLDNICFVILYGEEERFPKPVETVNSGLFERFHYFLNKRIEIANANNSVWAIGGRLEYIENDYLMLIEKSEKAATYVYAVGDFKIKTLRVLDN